MLDKSSCPSYSFVHLQHQVWTRVLHFSLLVLIHFIPIYNSCIVYAFDSTMVSCVYISFYYYCLCIMHLIQQRWVASTLDTDLKTPLFVFICVLPYLCFAVGEGGCLSVINLIKQLPFPNNEVQWSSILWPVFYYLMQYRSTVLPYLIQIATNLSPWCNTMAHITIFEKFFMSYRYLVYIPSPHFG